MAVAVASDFMTMVGDLFDEHWMPLGDPSQHKPRGMHLLPAEHIEQVAGVFNYGRAQSRPFIEVQAMLQHFGDIPLLKIYREQIHLLTHRYTSIISGRAYSSAEAARLSLVWCWWRTSAAVSSRRRSRHLW